MAYKSSNPALNKDTFNNLSSLEEPMSLEGVSQKSLLLIAFVAGSGAFGWRYVSDNPDSAFPLVIVAVIAALIISIITIFKKQWARITAPIYALLEGFAVGVISKIYNDQFEGIVLQALGLTLGIFLVMLLLYLTRIIKVTENLKLGIAAATGGVALYYMVDLIGAFVGFNLPLIHSNSPYGIVFTVLVVGLAAFNLVVDFDFIEKGVEQRAPKYMEWYASFGLLITLIWLYLEILRLLAKLRSR